MIRLFFLLVRIATKFHFLASVAWPTTSDCFEVEIRENSSLAVLKIRKKGEVNAMGPHYPSFYELFRSIGARFLLVNGTSRSTSGEKKNDQRRRLLFPSTKYRNRCRDDNRNIFFQKKKEQKRKRASGKRVTQLRPEPVYFCFALFHFLSFSVAYFLSHSFVKKKTLVRKPMKRKASVAGIFFGCINATHLSSSSSSPSSPPSTSSSKQLTADRSTITASHDGR